jgi:hypothetical protein
MNLTDKVFKIVGSKKSSLVLGENSIQVSSLTFSTLDDFNNSWTKSLTIATKRELQYESIKYVKKEESEDIIKIRYKGPLNITGECDFSFSDKNDYNLFFNYLVKVRYFSRADDRLSPFKSARPYIFWLIFIIGFTSISLFQFSRIQSGTTSINSDGHKIGLYNHLLVTIGDNGIWLIGTLIALYTVYKIRLRFKNPPILTTLEPPRT